MRKALGRGLDALIPQAMPVTETQQKGEATPSQKIPISKIRPNHLQPRKFFDSEKLQELAGSIREHGVAQPILVSYDEISETYELIAGERRLRAAELAGLNEIEIIIKNPASDKDRLALAITENIQREDLNPVETAQSYLKMIQDFGFSQADLTKILGKSKSAVSNTLRLLDLPDDMQRALAEGKITEGHARALLAVENEAARRRAFAEMLEQKLSVRAAEALARSTKAAPAPARAEKPADIRALENSLQEQLGTKVEIRTNAQQNRGRVSIHFYSLEDFDRILKIIKK
ncbi:MAG TPA: ParB/RepB/Spo0J family partition protein [Elusimicrobiota bacterium]|jgi:ParB family transcriptional regulator, chromosome partitioning protein|nr:ParB/RepB/Spo0J family partition protein [Elusimicrobiota bacterium]